MMEITTEEVQTMGTGKGNKIWNKFIVVLLDVSAVLVSAVLAYFAS